ncbi:MAG: phospho-sugar mutase [Ruthenibacterium sp.]
MNAAQRYQTWTQHPALDAAVAAELAACKDDAAAIDDRFYRDLEFGTGGLRGVLGAGSNRMNVYTVAKATRGFAAYLKANFTAPRCAVAYDSRHQSDVFARVTAAELAAAGVQVYLYPTLMPTPMLSFAVRHLACSGGVVITASHNPAKYNGYKVYGADGCQITLEAAEKVLACIQKQPDFAENTADFAQNLAAGTIQMIDAETVQAYYDAVLAESIEKPAVPLHVVYSPLNGAGNVPVRYVLDVLGNIHVTVVPQQEMPDGDFTTCPYPNPEMEEAMRLSVALCQEIGADFALATDPDCDRVGVAALDKSGKAVLINGNEMGVMLFDYICKSRLANGTMPQNPVAVKTIVTTEMAAQVARKYGVELRNVLTGFKFIGEQIGVLEAAGHAEQYIFGFEESYGYLSGAYVRDKDAVDAAMLICEMAAHHKAEGKNLLEVLDALYAEYGYYKNKLLSFAFEGAAGMHTMQNLLDDLRAQPPAQFAERKVLSVTDYQNDDTGLPKSNVLSFALEQSCQLLIRPSGTEPKLKIYVTAQGKTQTDAEKAVAALADACTALVAHEKG